MTLKILENILESGRYLILIAVVSTFIAALGTFLWGAYKTFEGVMLIIDSITKGADTSQAGIQMIAILDAFLLATILYIFAIALYELFISRLDVPEWLVIDNLDDLKLKLISVIILIMAVTFLEHLAQWKNALETMMFGISIAVVLIGLVFYSQYSTKHKLAKSQKEEDHA